MKKTIFFTGLFLAASFNNVGLAQQYSGTLGSSVLATDSFYLACPAYTSIITYSIRRNSGAVNIKAQGTSPVGLTTTTKSLGFFSPRVTVVTRGGAKFFKVSKATPSTARVSYTLQFEFYGKDGFYDTNDYPSQLTYIQNQ